MKRTYLLIERVYGVCYQRSEATITEKTMGVCLMASLVVLPIALIALLQVL